MTFLSPAIVLTLIVFILTTIKMGKLEVEVIKTTNTADAVALSSARIAAQHLNILGYKNTLTSLFFMGIKYGGQALMPVSLKPAFEMWHKAGMYPGYIGYLGRTLSIAPVVARANGSPNKPIPLFVRANVLRLKEEPLTVHFISSQIYAGSKHYDRVYYSRLWAPDSSAAQPVHEFSFRTGHAAANARLWLDVKPRKLINRLNNGGFPRSGYKKDNIFIQSCFPQFNARLTRRKYTGLIQ